MSGFPYGVLAGGAPFPGLRSFEADESLLFFGREAHIDELLERLADNRFVAVTGTSGSGKSSLVRAGLRPALHRGYLVDATSRWRFATLRPGTAPIPEARPSSSTPNRDWATRSCSGAISRRWPGGARRSWWRAAHSASTTRARSLTPATQMPQDFAKVAAAFA